MHGIEACSKQEMLALNLTTNYIKKIPFIVPGNGLLGTVNGMVEEMIDALKRSEAIESEREQAIIHGMIRELYRC